MIHAKKKLAPKNFRPKFFLTKKNFRPKFSLTQTNFRPKFFFDSKIIPTKIDQLIVSIRMEVIMLVRQQKPEKKEQRRSSIGMALAIDHNTLFFACGSSFSVWSTDLTHFITLRYNSLLASLGICNGFLSLPIFIFVF